MEKDMQVWGDHHRNDVKSTWPPTEAAAVQGLSQATQTTASRSALRAAARGPAAAAAAPRATCAASAPGSLRSQGFAKV